MHFFDFLQLGENDQIELLWYNGEHVGTRKDDDFMMLLYQVEGFYVEVYYHSKERIIKRYLCFECTDMLDPYLKNIDLSPVYKQLNKKTKSRDQQLSNVTDQDIIETPEITIKKITTNSRLSGIVSGIFNSLFSKITGKHV